MRIESLQNDKVKNWCKLKEKKYRDLTNTFLIEEEHLVEEALKHGVVKEILSLEEKEYNNVLVYVVTKEIMAKLTMQVTPPKVMAVCEKIKPKEIVGPVLFLDGIQDPGNLGTIIRSAVAFSMPNIVLNENTVDLYNPKVIRSTEGMIFSVNILRLKTEECFQFLKEKNYVVFGTDVFSGKAISSFDVPYQSAIIIGNEGRGMSPFCKTLCDDFFHIPMNPNCESLNAGVSASIIMYELHKKVFYGKN